MYNVNVYIVEFKNFDRKLMYIIDFVISLQQKKR